MMLAASEGTQFFGDQPVEWARTIDESLKLTPEQRAQIASRRQTFIDFKEILTKYIDDIHTAKSALEE